MQQLKYDPDCQYIKTWLQELRAVPSERIHALGTPTTPVPAGYPRMIVDHGVERRRALELYKTVTR